MDSIYEQGSLTRLIDIGIALSAEKNTNRLMEIILNEAKSLSNADGGTLYLKFDQHLEFEIIRNDSLNINLNFADGKINSLPNVQLYIDDKPNLQQVASKAALSGETINIADAYLTKDFDFSGTKEFDKGMGYRSKSFLTVPLKNHQQECIGVLQLLNAKDPATDEVVAFAKHIQRIIEALASQAAVALENNQLIKSQKKLLESFITLIATAIDEKSPHTGGHCQRVPELTNMLTQKICEANEGIFADFNLNEDQWYELHIAGWLHDCGKITTPEYVVNKATKLEAITDRIHEIRTRFEVLKRDAEITYLQELLKDTTQQDFLEKQLNKQLQSLNDDFKFIAESNIGGEFMSKEQIERVKKIASRQWCKTLDDRIGISID